MVALTRLLRCLACNNYCLATPDGSYEFYMVPITTPFCVTRDGVLMK